MSPDTVDYIIENEVTPEKIREIFARAYYSTDIDDDGDVIVTAESIRVYLSINKTHKLIKFSTFYGLDEDAPRESKHALANRMNHRVIFCRFTIPEGDEDTLVADYFLHFGERVTPFDIVSSFRLFALIVPSTIRDCDDDNLIK